MLCGPCHAQSLIYALKDKRELNTDRGRPEVYARQREQQTQRPGDKNELGVHEWQRKGQWGQSLVSERKISGTEGWKGSGLCTWIHSSTIDGDRDHGRKRLLKTATAPSSLRNFTT